MDIEKLVGKIFTEIIINESRDEILFIDNNGSQYKMYHSQSCCEAVGIEDINGDLHDLINSQIIKASEDTSNESQRGIIKEWVESFTWTFYSISTIKGTVTIRWYGSSNGYYSESVELADMNADEDR